MAENRIIRVEISEEDRQALNFIFFGIEEEIPKVMVKAINRTLKNVQTQSVKRIGQEYNLKADRIKKDFTVKNATYQNHNAWIKCKSRPPGLIQFSAKQTKRGVTYKIKRKGRRKLWRHAFIQTMTGAKGTVANEHVAVRTEVPKRAKFNPRFEYAVLPKPFKEPYEVKYGPRIASVWNTLWNNELQKHTDAQLSKNLDYETTRTLNRLKKLGK